MSDITNGEARDFLVLIITNLDRFSRCPFYFRGLAGLTNPGAGHDFRINDVST